MSGYHRQRSRSRSRRRANETPVVDPFQYLDPPPPPPPPPGGFPGEPKPAYYHYYDYGSGSESSDDDNAYWSREVKYANTKSQDTAYSYLAMGWGDKGFYLQTPTWADLKASVACKAAFGLSSSAIHATYYAQMRVDATCRRIDISREQYQRLVQFIAGDFRRDEAGHFIHIQTNANYGVTDAFYEAKGRYSLFYTCNTWANAALKHCGQKCCAWTIFDKSIFAKYEGK